MKNVVITIILLSVLAVPVCADVISIRADLWCPYNCAPDSAEPGYMIEIAKAVFEPAGHTVDYQELNWSRAIVETRDGKHVAIVGAAVGDAPDFVFPEESLGLAQNSFFGKKGISWRFQGVDSLKAVRLGLILDYDYGESLNAYIEEHKNTPQVQLSSGERALEVNIKKLEAGRIDIAVEDQNVFMMKASEMGNAELFENIGAVESETLEESWVYIAFSPANPKSAEYANILAEGIRALRASGELQKILAKYGLHDWK